ncbi:uncharacterized protein LOC106158268 [Lingula anatina]|uniref:Uncharacterized protein LOC106158268 n=1 Tax=Lingula anatina TaxID=7574 RepID=A0A1S3HUB8_LINAN|nr:uncharacterized protein LOC106158268 [Lingula anatina]|eukprot:XP_013389637.1 uncharacterized protein LOC106158268 [Lingula anatina]
MNSTCLKLLLLQVFGVVDFCLGQYVTDTCAVGSGSVVPPAKIGYTSARNDSSACTWEITGQPGQVLVLRISFSGTFRHEWIEKCTLAYVDIVQSNSNLRQGRFCGNTNPRYYQYIDGGVRIRFVTHMKGVQLNILVYNRGTSAPYIV